MRVERLVVAVVLLSSAVGCESKVPRDESAAPSSEGPQARIKAQLVVDGGVAPLAAAAPIPPTISETVTVTQTRIVTDTTTGTGTHTTTGTATATVTRTAVGTSVVTAQGTFTLTYTGTKTGTVTGTGTVSGTKTATGTGSWTGTYLGTGTATGTKTFTGTQSGSATVTGRLTLTATGTKTSTGTTTGSGTVTASASGTQTLTYTTPATATNTTSSTSTRTASQTATTTDTTTNPCVGSWAFCDNFESGTGAWNVRQGPVQNFSVIGDVTKVYAEGDSTASQLYISQAGSPWMDSTVQASLKPLSFSSATASSMVALWGHYDSTWGADCGYYVALRGDGKVALGKRVVGVDSVLGTPVSLSGGITAGTWYDVKLEMVDSTLKAYVNGTLMLTQTDTSCDAGSTGVGSLGASFETDNVRVTAPTTNTCVQDWRNTTCGAFCIYEAGVQNDRAGCGAYLDCYAANGCSPETCGGQDDVCGVNRPGLNTWGTASKEVADHVYKCMGCRGSVDCANPKYYNGTVCSDGNPCTFGDTCQNKVCTPDPNRNTKCSALDPCHDVGMCETTSGQCSNPAKGEGAWCEDGDACTENGQCTANGACLGTPKQCNTPPEAQCYEAVGTCANNTCTYTPKADFAPCDDGNADTVEDSCQLGICQGLFAAKHIVSPGQSDTVQSQLPGGFSVSPDGAAAYTIPLDIPEGRAGISPRLALSYSSQGGNGMLGVGWSLSGATSQITRCPKIHAVDSEAYPVTLDVAQDSNGNWTYPDRFCLDGDYLVAPDNPTISGEGLTEYRPEHNPSVRVTMKTSNGGSVDGVSGPQSFLVEYPDGKKATYGTTWTVMQAAAVQANHKNFDPTYFGVKRSRYQAWFLSKVSDPAGNTMAISYSGAATGACDSMCEVVPDTIAYTSYVNAAGVTTTPALRKVVFGYKARTDTSNAWVAGVQLGSSKLLETITVSGPNPTDISTLWTYTLRYNNDSVSGRSLLHSVKQCDASGLCKPETTFDWEKGASTFTRTQYLSLGSAVKIADLNGDGLPDLISATATTGSLQPIVFIAFKSRTGDKGLDYSQISDTGISSDLVGQDPLADLTPIDIDGDGTAELAVRQNENGKQWLRFYRFNGTKFEQMVDDGNEVPDNIDQYIYVGDLDGDGLPELIRAVSGKWEYRKNNGGVLGPYALLGPPKSGGGTTPVPAIREYNNYLGDLDGSGRSTILLMTGLSETDTRYGGLYLTQRSANGVTSYASTVPWVARNAFDGMGKVLLDLNGDGMADAVEFPVPAGRENSSSTYFVNTGRGMLGGMANFVAPMTATEQIYADTTGNDIFIVMDVNQDGRDDIVSAPWATIDQPPGTDKPLRAFLSNGTSLSEPTTLSYNDEAGGGTIDWRTSTTGGKFHSLDANGDGLADFMMADNDASVVNIYLHDGKKADMIVSFNNGSGSSVEVTYSPWERHEPYSKPADCKYPVRCPARGIWVVSDYHLNLHDGAETYPEYTYTYDLPAIDVLGRGWLGFGKRSVTLAPTGEVTSFWTPNTFRRGTSYPDAGHPGTVQTDVLLENGVLLTRFTANYSDLISGNIDSPGHSFAYGYTGNWYQESETTDSGKGVATRFRNSTTDVTYDSYANVYEAKRSTDHSTDSSVVTHLNDVTNWILSPPTQVLSTSAQDGTMVVRTTNYDYSPTLPRSLTKVTVEPEGDASTHLEISVTGWNKFALPQSVDAADRAGTHRTGSVVYDELEGSQPIAITNSVGQTSHTAYHKGLNLPIWTSDINALPTDLYYYPFGRLQSVVPPDNNTLTMSYTSPPADVGGVLQVTSSLASGQVKSKVFDLLDRPISASSLSMNGKMSRTDRWYNRVFLGKVNGVTIPYFTGDTTDHPYTWFSYDLAGRLQAVNAADGRVATVEYSGLKTTTTDPNGNKSYSIEDQLGRISKNVSIMPASDVGGAREITTQYVWSPFSLLGQVIDANNNIVKTTYDTLGRASATTDPDRGNRTLTFDAFANLVTVLDAKGTTTFTPDALGRTTKVVSPDGTATYTWDTAANGKGELASSTSTDGVEKTMTYDKLSRVESETWKIDGEGYAIGMTYDASLGRLDTVSYPEVPGFSQLKTKYGYAANGEVVSLKDVPSGTTAARQFWKADDRDPAGRIKQEEFGDGSLTTYGIDQVRAVVTGITTTLGTSTLQSLGYDYDNNLNVKTRSDAVAGVSEKFDYDALDRLHTWQEVGSYGWNVTYSHDDIGNLTGRALLGSKGETESLTFEHSGANAGPHGVTKSAWGTYGYDGKGNQTSSPEGTIAYTAFGLPKKIVGVDTTIFKYDASGARVLKQSTVNAGTTIYAGGSYERRTEGTEKTHVFYLSASGRQIGQVLRKESDHSETVLYIHSDALGSSEIVTDASGRTVGQRRKYDPFGAPTDITLPKGFPGGALISSDVHRGFTGHEEDSETGLINMRGRIYNPRVGHFLTPDPLVNDPLSAVGINPYAYVLNNPLNYTDPTGFEMCVGSCTMDPLNVDGNVPGGGEDGGGSPIASGSFMEQILTGLTFDVVGWAEYPEMIGTLPDTSTRILKLPGGGWVREDQPGAIHFQTSDGRYGVIGPRDYFRIESQSPGEISTNPDLMRANTVAPGPPMAVGGQSAAGGHGSGVLAPFTKAPIVLAMVPGGEEMAQRFAKSTEPRRPNESFLHYVFRLVAAIASAPGTEMFPMVGVVKGAQLATSGAVNALQLAKQLASEATAAELLAGGGKIMAGAGTKMPIRDVARLVSQYGGEAGDWAKITSATQKMIDGVTIETHAYKNISTGVLYELKTKLGMWP